MTYPFVASYVNLGTARGPRLAVVWHMAEGGGTVGYLAKTNPNGVSVHFVIEYTGRTVQMLHLDRMHTSIRTSSIRTTDDAPYDWRGTAIRYGATDRTAVMGKWGDIRSTLGPNHASIGVEIEGFAATGPSDKQKDAMARLWGDLRTRYPGIRSLGHRDFASYKSCPGKKVPWEEVGGHGPVPQEDSVRNFTLLYDGDGRTITGTVTFPDDPAARYLDLSAGTLHRINPAWVKQAVKVRLTEPMVSAKPDTDDWTLGWLIGDDAAFVLDRNATFAGYEYPITVTIGGNTVKGTVTLP